MFRANNEKNIILNPSCSELVTYLGITNAEEIRYILKRICQKFNFKVKLIPSNFDPVNNPGVEVDIDKIGVSKSLNVLTFDHLLIDPNLTELQKGIKERTINHDYFQKHKNDPVKLKNLVGFLSNKTISIEQYIKLVLMDENNVFVEIQYRFCSGYDETPGLSLLASDSKSLNEYNLLGNVYLTNTKLFKYKAFGAGKASNFREWINIKVNKGSEELEKWMKSKNYEEVYLRNFSFEGNEKQ